jgi:hypothetical protein
MFKIDCMVEDRHLASAMKELAKLKVLNLTAMPVVLASSESNKAKTGKSVKEAPSTMVGLIKAVADNGRETVSSAELAAGCTKNNLSYQAAMYGLKVMVNKGYLIRRMRGEYTINREKLSQ